MKTTSLVLLLASAFLVFGSNLAGTLDPPGPPAPTMVTLQQIHDKACAPADVAKTGQTGCWDTSGPISCTGTGQDGAFQNGVSVSPRFTDRANGTVRDNLTGLVWLKNANCFGLQTWTIALSDSNSLASGSCGLTDGSVAGAWRLPNVNELASLIDLGGAGNPALAEGHPFSGVETYYYWSSTTWFTSSPGFAAVVNLGDGVVYPFDKSDAYHVWPVRSGL
jgi:hypothetical protein